MADSNRAHEWETTLAFVFVTRDDRTRGIGSRNVSGNATFKYDDPAFVYFSIKLVSIFFRNGTKSLENELI